MTAAYHVSGIPPDLTATKAPKPVLRPSPRLGGWPKDVGGSLCFTTDLSSRRSFLSAGEDGQTEAQERIVGSAMGLTIEGVVSELYDAAFTPGITRFYTPGFSEPDRDGQGSATSDSNGTMP